MKPYLILPLLLLPWHLHAQPVSAIPLPAAPGAYSPLNVDAFSAARNPAALASVQVFSAGIYSARHFMLPDIRHGFLAAAFPLMKGGAGIQLNYLKSGAYTQSEIGIAYAKKLGRADLGIKFNYHKLSVLGYGSAGSAVIDIGSIWHVTDDLHAGVNFYNPVGAKKLSAVYTAGLGYDVSAQVLLCTEIIKEENKPPNIVVVVQYKPVARVLLQAGIATATAQPYLSAGFRLGAYQIQFCISYHAQLGFSPAFALMYQSTKRS